MCSLLGGTLFLIINARQSIDSYIDVAIIIFTPFGSGGVEVIDNSWWSVVTLVDLAFVKRMRLVCLVQ
jgi:hypothetical protein